MLGSGQFAEVFRGEWVTPQGTQEVAIKVLREGHAENDKVKLLQEAAVMAQFRHPHIVRLLGAVTVDEPVRGMCVWVWGMKWRERCCRLLYLYQL